MQIETTEDMIVFETDLATVSVHGLSTQHRGHVAAARIFAHLMRTPEQAVLFVQDVKRHFNDQPEIICWGRGITH